MPVTIILTLIVMTTARAPGESKGTLIRIKQFGQSPNQVTTAADADYTTLYYTILCYTILCYTILYHTILDNTIITTVVCDDRGAGGRGGRGAGRRGAS